MYCHVLKLVQGCGLGKAPTRCVCVCVCVCVRSEDNNSSDTACDLDNADYQFRGGSD